MYIKRFATQRVLKFLYVLCICILFLLIDDGKNQFGKLLSTAAIADVELGVDDDGECKYVSVSVSPLVATL